MLSVVLQNRRHETRNVYAMLCRIDRDRLAGLREELLQWHRRA
jgi:hypothetical protein